MFHYKIATLHAKSFLLQSLVTPINTVYRPIHYLTPWNRVLLEKLTGLQLVVKFPAFYWTVRFITAFTISSHLTLSWASSIQFKPPHPNSWRPILIVSYQLRLGLPSGIFPLGFPPNPCTRLSSPHPSYMPRPSHSSRFYHPHNFGWAVQIIKLLIINFPYSLLPRPS
jgi:hypothetical protein